MLSWLYTGTLGGILAPEAPLDHSLTEELIIAALQGEKPRILELLRAGADANARNDSGNSALHAAAARGHLEAVMVLLEAKARVSARGKRGNTPLHYACRGQFVDVAALLIEHGASTTVRNDAGYTPLGVVLAVNQLEDRTEADEETAPPTTRALLRLLREADTDPARDGGPADASREEAVRLLLRGGEAGHIPPPPAAFGTSSPDDTVRRALEAASKKTEK